MINDIKQVSLFLDDVCKQTDLEHSKLFVSFTMNSEDILSMIYVTQSGKTSLITYLKVLRNASLKCSVCCSLPMVELLVPNFHMFYTNFLPSRASTVEVANTYILDSFYLDIDSTRPRKAPKRWEVGAGGEQENVFKN